MTAEEVVPPELRAYLSDLVARLRSLLDRQLLGVYVGGSVALDDYVPGRSDVDVAVVTRGALDVGEKEAIVAELRHESLACPARGLELVVYAEATVAEASADPGFELELNSGSDMDFHAAFDPGGANASHWYVLDRAILANHGVALVGPQPAAVFADVPRELVLPALAESIGWFAAHDAPGSSAVLNACRALRYAADDRWSPKTEAGRWALEHLDDDRELIAQALRGRETSEPLDPARTKPFLARAQTSVGSFRPVRRQER